MIPSPRAMRRSCGPGPDADRVRPDPARRPPPRHRPAERHRPEGCRRKAPSASRSPPTRPPRARRPGVGGVHLHRPQPAPAGRRAAARPGGTPARTDRECGRRKPAAAVRAGSPRLRGPMPQRRRSRRDVLAARYALCTVLDEAVLNTPWGAQSGWAGQSLLVTFHREAQGGEKFFQILDRLLGEPQRYLALLELLYVCLALGFEGRYRLDERGANRLAEIRRDLYRRIEQLRGGSEPELSPHWKGVEDRRNAVLRLVPLVGGRGGVRSRLLVGTWSALRLAAERSLGAHQRSAAQTSGCSICEAAAPANAAPSGLAGLLARRSPNSSSRSTSRANARCITVTVPDLFASGSARVNARYRLSRARDRRRVGQRPGAHPRDRVIRTISPCARCSSRTTTSSPGARRGQWRSCSSAM